MRCDRYHATADLALLDAAEATYQAALEETPPGSPQRTARLCHPTTVGIERWRAAGARRTSTAVTLAGQAGPAGAATHAALLGRRHEATGEADDLRRLAELHPVAGSI